MGKLLDDALKRSTTAPIAPSQGDIATDPAELWDRYCAETPASRRTPQGAMAFAVDAIGIHVSRPITPSQGGGDLPDRIALYLDDTPHGGGHSDAAGSNCWELLEEAMGELRSHATLKARIEALETALANVRQELWVSYCLRVGRTDTDMRPFDSKPHIRIIDAALAFKGGAK